MTRVSKRSLPAGRRVITVSDIHGNLPYLRGLLAKLGFSDGDMLIVDGDFLEKGTQSLDTLRFIMRLCEKGVCWVVRGNCDGWHQILGGNMDGFIMDYMLRRPDCVLRQMCRSQGLEVDAGTPLETVKSLLRAHFADEMDFLASLPIAIDTEEHTFVHGGISSRGMLESEPWRCMKNDDFLGQGLSFDKWQIVGHWPVALYREDLCCSEPIILPERHIASIDGGCVLMDDGQLNALIIEPGCEGFAAEHYDGFPVMRALDAQSASERSFYIRWNDSAVEPLSESGGFTRCRHVRTGYVMDVLSERVRPDGRGGFTASDCTDYRLPVAPGDALSVVYSTDRGHFCKKNGVSGWYSGRLAPLGE